MRCVECNGMLEEGLYVLTVMICGRKDGVCWV